MTKIPRPSFQRSFSVIYYETPTRNMFGCSKRKKLDWWFQVVKGFNYGQEPNKRNFVAKSGLSRFTHGGLAEGVGVTISHKNYDVIYEQPIRRFKHVEFEGHLHDCMSVSYFC